MKKEQGFVRLIIIIVLALIILGFFGINVRQAIESPTTQSNLNYFWVILTWIWDHVLETPIMFLWNVVILPLIQKVASSR